MCLRRGTLKGLVKPLRAIRVTHGFTRRSASATAVHVIQENIYIYIYTASLSLTDLVSVQPVGQMLVSESPNTVIGTQNTSARLLF